MTVLNIRFPLIAPAILLAFACATSRPLTLAPGTSSSEPVDPIAENGRVASRSSR